MANEDGRLFAAAFSNEIIQVLHMRGDRERSATTDALKGFEHMPLLPQFSRERSDVPGRTRPAVQQYHRLHPGPVFPDHQISHSVLVLSG
jgi:hypothetical protein